ncbi:MAG: proteasome component M29 [Caeruleum heppii]|nr:MAG: proteasome component M29 [Caeruleum heppii]
MSSSAVSSEAKELQLLDKLELRIALSDSTPKLQGLLNTYLPPLLLKLGSESERVRNKASLICQHVSSRIGASPVHLPVKPLLQQFKERRESTLIRTFNLSFVQKGVPQLTSEERAELIPTLLADISVDANNSPSQGATLFNLFLRLLPSLKFPARGTHEDGQMRGQLGLVSRPDDAAFLVHWLGKFMLLTLDRSNNPGAAASVVHPGLTPQEYEFLTLARDSDTWTTSSEGGLSLTDSKVYVCQFVSSGALTDPERLLPALFASADHNSRISEIGSDLLKRVVPNVSLEDVVLIEKLYWLYFGDQDSAAQPVRQPLRIKMLHHLSKSVVATTFTNRIVQLVEEGLAAPPTNQIGFPVTRGGAGREASKLRECIFSFLHWVARVGSSEDLHTLAPALVHRLRDFIESQGWPLLTAEADNATLLALRCQAYSALGLVAKTSAKDVLWEPNLDLLRWLFTSLCAETGSDDVAMSVDEALSSALQAFPGDLDSEVQASLRSLLLLHMDLEIGDESPAGSPSTVHRSTRFVAVRFANRCLPFSDPQARWIDLLAMGGRLKERGEVIEEGKKGLDPYWYQMLNPAGPSEKDLGKCFPFPSFAGVVQLFYGSNEPRNAAGLPGTGLLGLLEPERRGSVNVPAIGFARRLLLTEMLQGTAAVKIDPNFESRLNAAVSTDVSSREMLKAQLRQRGSNGSREYQEAISTYAWACFNSLVNGDDDRVDVYGDYLVEVCSLSGDTLMHQMASRIAQLKRPILAANTSLRLAAAHVTGLLASHPHCPPQERDSVLGSLLAIGQQWRAAVGSEIYKVHGAIVALSFASSRMAARRQIPVKALGDETRCLALEVFLEARDTMLQEAGVIGISQLCLSGVLSVSTIPAPHTFGSLKEGLRDRAKGGDDEAILSLGRLALASLGKDDDGEAARSILDELYGLHEMRQLERHFVVGDAISCVAAGFAAQTLKIVVDMDDFDRPDDPPDQKLGEVLHEVLRACGQTKPALRRAACIWLFSLIKNCGHLAAIQDRLRICQAAFGRFLADREDLVQETATRGLTLVYENGNAELKESLVRDLVATFTGNSAALSGNIDLETELFEPGALPTGEGSVSTYKDVTALALEVGDPSLVYRFMSMASNSALWSSRAALGKYGLGNILLGTGAQGLVTQNPKLIVKLFRYRFDPNTRVQQSMNDIWTSMVTDSTKTIDHYFDDIMEDLLANVMGKEWRVRQAALLAIRDLIQTHDLSKYESYLGPTLTWTFKLLDDIKDSVRGAAQSLCKTLTNDLVRIVEAHSTRKASVIVSKAMPLISSALEDSAKDVRGAALDMALRLVRTGAPSLRPVVPGLIERLLGLLSGLEPEEINYLHLNASKYNLTEEKIDGARLMSVRNSPTMDAIERCIDLLDEESMAAVVPRLENAIDESLGLPSKVGCSRVLVSLCTRKDYIFRPHASRFIRIMQKLVADRNDTVASSYAAAMGYLCRITPADQDVLRVGDFCRTLYLGADEIRHRLVAADVVHSISKHATDRLGRLASTFLPFAFLGKHDPHTSTRQVFEQTWSDNVGGSKSVGLYLQEIVQLATPQLESPRWLLKHTAALTIADAARSGGADVDVSQQQMLWTALEQALAGKTWDGKETVLQALAVFCQRTRTLQEKKVEIAEQMKKILLREAKRTNLSYRQHALRVLGDCVSLYHDDGVFSDEVYALVQPVIEHLLDEGGEAMDVDTASDGALTTSTRDATLASAISCVLQFIHPKLLTTPDGLSWTIRALNLVLKARPTPATDVQAALCDGVASICQRLRQPGTAPISPIRLDADVVMGMLRIVSPLDQGSVTERSKRAEACLRLAEVIAAEGQQRLSEVSRLLRDEVVKAQKVERDRSVRVVLDRALSQ